MTRLSASNRTLIIAALLGAFLPFLWVLWLIIQATGGTFEYPLDDPYIHLAISEEIARGGFGVNVGESTWPSSSILYPYLLVPFVSTSFHHLVPAYLGVAAMSGCAILWGKIVATGRGGLLGDGYLLLIAAIGPMAIHMPEIALLGMEHALQMAATLMVVLGLSAFVRDDKVTAILVAGLILGPLIRYENIVVSGLACGILLFSGRVRTSILLGAAVLTPVIAYSLVMNRLGLGYLPNSIAAKSVSLNFLGAIPGSSSEGQVSKMVANILFNISLPPGAMIVFISAIWLVLVFGLRNSSGHRYMLLALSIPILLLIHLFAGQITNSSRYTAYLWAYATGAGVVVISAMKTNTSQWAIGARRIPILMLAVGLYQFTAVLFVSAPETSAAIYFQQRQMGRFVDEFYQKPVAVNDLGHVAYRNDVYVLDLWGLASKQALIARFATNGQGWAKGLIDGKDVSLAMVYDDWLRKAIPVGWTKVAVLHLKIPRGMIARADVSFYSRPDGSIDDLMVDLNAFKETLPEQVILEILDPAQESNIVRNDG